jgi:hypothetical protein
VPHIDVENAVSRRERLLLGNPAAYTLFCMRNLRIPFCRSDGFGHERVGVGRLRFAQIPMMAAKLECVQEINCGYQCVRLVQDRNWAF